MKEGFPAAEPWRLSISFEFWNLERNREGASTRTRGVETRRLHRILKLTLVTEETHIYVEAALLGGARLLAATTEWRRVWITGAGLCLNKVRAMWFRITQEPTYTVASTNWKGTKSQPFFRRLCAAGGGGFAVVRCGGFKAYWGVVWFYGQVSLRSQGLLL